MFNHQFYSTLWPLCHIYQGRKDEYNKDYKMKILEQDKTDYSEYEHTNCFI